MNEIDELIAKYRIEQSRYAYYIIALCVAAIGFSISQTMGRALHYELWPLGLSVLLFGFSVFSGLRFIRLIIGSIATDIDVKQVQTGNSAILIKAAASFGQNPNSPEMKTFAIESLLEVVNEKSKQSSLWYNSQVNTFYSGIVSFLAWRIYDMYLLSSIATPAV